MSVKLLTEHHLEFLSLKGGCTGLSESTFVKIPHLLEITCHSSNFDCIFWSTVKDVGRPWSIYEAYQVIIQHQVEALIKLGAHKSLKVTVHPKQTNPQLYTVKPVQSSQSKEIPKYVFKTDNHLMQVKSISICSHGAF